VFRSAVGRKWELAVKLDEFVTLYRAETARLVKQHSHEMDQTVPGEFQRFLLIASDEQLESALSAFTKYSTSSPEGIIMMDFTKVFMYL